MKRRITYTVTVIMGLAAATMLFGCAALKPAPSADTYKNPIITLSHVEVAHYWGWWYFKKTVAPTMGTAGDYGAPLDLAFVFDIENPNDYPVQMETLNFTIAFEEFDLNTVSSIETQWIPAHKTNQLRVHAMFDGRQSLLSLLVTGGFKLQERGLTGAGGALKQLGIWWEGIPEFAFPIYVKQGTAVFSAGEVSQPVTFSSKYP